MGLLGVFISERLDRDIIRVNQILISQYKPLFFKPFVKKLKKEVIIEVEEQTTQVESSTQKLEELVGGQQKKIDEDNQLESQVQNLEDVAKIIEDDTTNSFDEDMNQKEGKCVLEQEKIHTNVHEERKEIPVLDKLNPVTIK